MHPDLFRLFGVAFPVVLRPAAVGLPLRDRRSARSGRGASARAPTSSSTSGLAMLLAGVVGRAPAARRRRRLLLGLRAPLHRPVEGRSGRSTRRDCLSAAYGGVWDAARRRLPPEGRPTALPGRSSGRAASRTTAGSLGASVAAWLLLKRDAFPFWKAADMAGFAIPLGLGVRPHGLPDGRAAASARRATCRGRCRSPGGARRARSSSAITCCASREDVEPAGASDAALRVGRLARHRGRVPALGARSQALRRAGLRRVPRALRGRALPARDSAARRPRGLLGLSTSQLLGLAMLGARGGHPRDARARATASSRSGAERSDVIPSRDR